MKARILVSALAIALAAMGPATLLTGRMTAAIAADSVSEQFAKTFNEAAELIKNKQPKEGLAKLGELQASNAYEEYLLGKIKVSAYAQLDDYAHVAPLAESLATSDKATDAEKSMYKQAAAAAYLNSGNTDKFAALSNNDPEMKPMVAKSYLKQGNFAKAESTIRESIDAAGPNAKEDWYLILAEAQRKGGNVAGSKETALKLLKTHPKPEYWQYVLYNMLNGGSEGQRLDVYRLLYHTNAMESGDYTAMAQTAFSVKLPGDAKRALEKGAAAGALDSKGKSLRGTAQSKAASDLKVLPSIEGQAAAQKTGEALASIADSYLSNGQFEKAAGLYQKALAKGGLPDPVAAKLHLGVAYAGANQTAQARETFNSLSGKGRVGELASLWLIALGS